MAKDEPISMTKLQSISTTRFSVISIDGINEKNKSIVGTKLQQESLSKNRMKLKLLDPAPYTEGNTTDHPFLLLENIVDPLVHAMTVYKNNNNNNNTTLKTSNDSIVKEKGLIQSTAPAAMTGTTIPKITTTTTANAVTNVFSKNMIDQTKTEVSDVKEIKNGIITDSTKSVVSSTSGTTSTARHAPAADLQTVTTSASSSPTVTTSNEVSSQHSTTFVGNVYSEIDTPTASFVDETINKNTMDVVLPVSLLANNLPPGSTESTKEIITEIVPHNTNDTVASAIGPVRDDDGTTTTTIKESKTTTTSSSSDRDVVVDASVGTEIEISNTTIVDSKKKSTSDTVSTTVESPSTIFPIEDIKGVTDTGAIEAKIVDATIQSITNEPTSTDIIKPSDKTCTETTVDTSNKFPVLSSTVTAEACESISTPAGTEMVINASNTEVFEVVDNDGFHDDSKEVVDATLAIAKDATAVSASTTPSTVEVLSPKDVPDVVTSIKETRDPELNKDSQTTLSSRSVATITASSTNTASDIIGSLVDAESAEAAVAPSVVSTSVNCASENTDPAPPPSSVHPILPSERAAAIVEKDISASQDKPQTPIPTVVPPTPPSSMKPILPVDKPAAIVEKDTTAIKEKPQTSAPSVVPPTPPPNIKRILPAETPAVILEKDTVAIEVIPQTSVPSLVPPTPPRDMKPIRPSDMPTPLVEKDTTAVEGKPQIPLPSVGDIATIHATVPELVAKIENGIKANSVDVSSPTVTESRKKPVLSNIAKDTDAVSAAVKKSSTPTSTTESDEVVLVPDGSGLDTTKQTISPLRDSPKNQDDDSKTPSTGIVCHCSICVIS